MKKSKLEAAETRDRIVMTAAAEFRRNGISETGLSALMAAAGLTHGGFYRHFASKDQLVAEACEAAMASVIERLQGGASEQFGNAGLGAIAARYLSLAHRDNPSEGCPIAGLGSELARSDDDARAAATRGFLKLVDLISKQYGRRRPDVARARAMAALSAMIGAITISRIVTDPELSVAILQATKKHLANAPRKGGEDG